MRMKHRMESFLVRIGLRVFSCLPWPTLSVIGKYLGRLAWTLGIRRSSVRENLNIAFGKELDKPDRIARKCYECFGRTHLEYFALPRLREKGILESIEVEGREHLEAAQERGKGIILLMSHFGNWELVGLMGMHLGLDVHLLVGDLSNSRVDEQINEMRERLGLKILRRGMALRSTLKLLRENKTVLFPGDQEARYHGITVPMFGRRTLTHPGAAHFALKTGAAILMGFPIRDGSRFRFRFLPPILPEGEATKEAVIKWTAVHTAALESMVREFPEQWFWLHRRWKAAPKGEDGLPEKASLADPIREPGSAMP
jgi:KDO2-lipid IV(A) lauroyltransferase